MDLGRSRLRECTSSLRSPFSGSAQACRLSKRPPICDIGVETKKCLECVLGWCCHRHPCGTLVVLCWTTEPSSKEVTEFFCHAPAVSGRIIESIFFSRRMTSLVFRLMCLMCLVELRLLLTCLALSRLRVMDNCQSLKCFHLTDVECECDRVNSQFTGVSVCSCTYWTISNRWTVTGQEKSTL